MGVQPWSNFASYLNSIFVGGISGRDVRAAKKKGHIRLHFVLVSFIFPSPSYSPTRP